MKIHDVTRPLFHQDIVYPGDTLPSFRQEERGGYLISDLSLSSHAGTHVDAPVHYLKTGQSVDEIPPGALIGRCRVADVREAGSRITAAVLNRAAAGCRRLLLRTAFSGSHRFDPEYPHLTADAAKLIARRRLRCIGTDSPSIESYSGDGSVHRELLGSGCIVMELLDLADVSEGDYTLIALPLRLYGVDGAPARIVLIEEEEESPWTLSRTQ